MLHQTHFFQMSYHKPMELILTRWHDDEMIRDEDFKKQRKIYLDWAQKRLPRAALHNRKFVVSPDLQTWNDIHITQSLKNTPLRHIAIILNDEFIAQLSVEQAVSEEAPLPFSQGFLAAKRKEFAGLQ